MYAVNLEAEVLFQSTPAVVFNLASKSTSVPFALTSKWDPVLSAARFDLDFLPAQLLTCLLLVCG